MYISKLFRDWHEAMIASGGPCDEEAPNRKHSESDGPDVKKQCL